MGHARSRMQSIGGIQNVSLLWDSNSPSVMLNLPSKNGQININILYSCCSEVPKCTNKAENQSESVTSSDIPVLFLREERTLTSCHSRWCTVGTQKSPWVSHSAGQRGHSRVHSPKLVTGRKKGRERGDWVHGRVCSRWGLRQPKGNQHHSDGSSIEPWNHSWPTDLLGTPEIS